MTAEQFYDAVLKWASHFNVGFKSILEADKAYWTKVFSIERGGAKPRKDIAVFSEVEDAFSYFIKENKFLNFFFINIRNFWKVWIV